MEWQHLGTVLLVISRAADSLARIIHERVVIFEILSVFCAQAVSFQKHTARTR